MPRQQERTPVILDIILEGASGKREARITDISLSGCFIETMTPVNAGESVSFQIIISDKEMLSLRGEIVTVFPGVGFGIRFNHLWENKKTVLEHIILMNSGNPWGKD